MNNKYEVQAKESPIPEKIYIKGIGTITAEGRLDFENWLNDLLNCKYITGID